MTKVLPILQENIIESDNQSFNVFNQTVLSESAIDDEIKAQEIRAANRTKIFQNILSKYSPKI